MPEPRSILIVAGGVIPPGDHQELLDKGAAAIFGPGTVIADAATQLLETLSERLGHQAGLEQYLFRIEWCRSTLTRP